MSRAARWYKIPAVRTGGVVHIPLRDVPPTVPPVCFQRNKSILRLSAQRAAAYLKRVYCGDHGGMPRERNLMAIITWRQDMRQLSDSEVKSRAETLKKRHRSEWARLVYEACVKRSMQEVADLLGYTRQWVADHLKWYAIELASGGGNGVTPSSDTKRDDVNQVVKQFAPDEPSEEYIAEYEFEGHTPEVAKCLANAYEAGENAIEEGVIQESVDKRNRRVSKIVLPDDRDWEMKLRLISSTVKLAARELNVAHIADLKLPRTRKRVAEAHAAWMEQIERLQNFHPTFGDEVNDGFDDDDVEGEEWKKK